MSVKRIYGCADIARYLGVTKAAVSNNLKRFSDTPRPDYVTPDGRMYWDRTGLTQWQHWQNGS